MATKEKFASCAFSDFYDATELYRSQTGAVFRAFFKYDKKEYILKERKLPELGRRKDIMNEVKLLLQLSHPNVVRCEGWFRDEVRKSLFIVLEYCDGGDLYKLIEFRKLNHNYFDERQIWFIFNQICQGLRHLHENGIVHRDLKSLNIMLTKRGRVFKIGDLGVSRQVSEETVMLNTFYGTPLYLSPELVENKPYNEKTDMWSLGVLLYEMTTFTVPFKANTILALAKQVLKGKYNPISNQYSSHLERCIAWLLQLDFAKRPNVMQVIDFVQGRLSPEYYGQGLGLLGADSVENLEAVVKKINSREHLKRDDKDDEEEDEGSEESMEDDSLCDGNDSDRTASDDERPPQRAPQQQQPVRAAVAPQPAPQKVGSSNPASRPNTAGANLLHRNNAQNVDISKLNIEPRRSEAPAEPIVNERRSNSNGGESSAVRRSFDLNSRLPNSNSNNNNNSEEVSKRRSGSNNAHPPPVVAEMTPPPPVPEAVSRGRPQTAGANRHPDPPRTSHQARDVPEQGRDQAQPNRLNEARLPPRPERVHSEAAPVAVQAAPAAVVEVQAESSPKRKSNRKQKHGRSRSPERGRSRSPEKGGGRGRSKSPGKMDVEVTVDVQRVHILLRRVTAQFRKLCQVRDFISNAPTDASAMGSPTSGGDKKAVLEKIAELQVSVKILEKCMDSGGKMKYIHAQRFELLKEDQRQHQPSPPTVPKMQPAAGVSQREHKYPAYNVNDINSNANRDIHIADINSHSTAKEIQKMQGHQQAHVDKHHLQYASVDVAPTVVVEPEKRHDVGGFDVLNHGINGHSKKNDLFKFNAHIDHDGLVRPQTAHGGSRKHSGEKNVAFKEEVGKVKYVNHSHVVATDTSNRPHSAMSRLIQSDYSDMLAHRTHGGSRSSANSTSEDSTALKIGMMADKYRDQNGSHRRVISDVTALNEEKERNKHVNHKNRGINIITGC